MTSSLNSQSQPHSLSGEPSAQLEYERRHLRSPSSNSSNSDIGTESRPSLDPDATIPCDIRIAEAECDTVSPEVSHYHKSGGSRPRTLKTPTSPMSPKRDYLTGAFLLLL